jgi:hypothetical protein
MRDEQDDEHPPPGLGVALLLSAPLWALIAGLIWVVHRALK